MVQVAVYLFYFLAQPGIHGLGRNLEPAVEGSARLDSVRGTREERPCEEAEQRCSKEPFACGVSKKVVCVHISSDKEGG